MSNNVPPGFGARLAHMRKLRGLTQEQLGEGLGADGKDVGKQAVSSWEVERNVPNGNQIFKMCQRLNCSSDYLYGIQRSVSEWDGKERRTEHKAA